MRKSLRFLCLLLVCLTVLSCSVSAQTLWDPPFLVESRAVFLVDQTTGEVIYSKNSSATMPQASITKLMTAILTVQRIKNLNKVVTVSHADLDPLYGTGYSTAGLAIGEKVTVRQLLYCLLVKSACDAANCLARTVSGNTTKFVQLMNRQADKIGARHTHYRNAHGLTAKGHYSTAYDTYIIARYAMHDPLLRKIVDTKTYTLPATNKHRYARRLKNTNAMLSSSSSYYYSLCRGIKTGYTSAAGHCIVTDVRKGGDTYYCVILGAPAGDGNLAMLESRKLYQWVFDDMGY